MWYQFHSQDPSPNTHTLVYNPEYYQMPGVYVLYKKI